MSDFDALLKRSFAEAHEPADVGFSVNVANAVARRESGAKVWSAVQAASLTVAGAAVLFGAYGVAVTFGPQWSASLGLSLAQAHGAITADAVTTQGLMRTLGGGLTQILLAAGAIAGGAVAYRSAQE